MSNTELELFCDNCGAEIMESETHTCYDCGSTLCPDCICEDCENNQ